MGRARFELSDSPLDLSCPGGLGVGIGWAVETGEQLGGNLRPVRDVKSEGISENGCTWFDHAWMIFRDSIRNKRSESLGPTPHDEARRSSAREHGP